MANTIKLRRSAVASAVPTTSQIALGELGINTADGVLYLKRSTDGAETGGTTSILAVGGPNFGSRNLITTGTVTGASFIPTSNTAPTDGVYLPAANSVAVATNSAERLRITSAGNVGIGTTGPAATLHISSAGQATTSLDTTGSLNAIISDTGINVDNGGSVVFAANAGAWRFAAIKGLVLSGVANTLGDIAFLTRNATSDSTLRESLRIGYNGTTTLTSAASTAPFIAKISTSEAARIDSSGRLLVGTSSARTAFYGTNITGNILQIEKADNAGATFVANFNDAFARGFIVLAKSRGATLGSNTVVQSGDNVGEIVFAGADGTQPINLASINAFVDGTPGTNDMPGRLVFSTTADGASSTTERLRITSAGVLKVADAGNIEVGTTTGTKIGTGTTQKLGFFNNTPVAQPAAVADATDAASVITQLNALLARMRDLGLIAT